MAGEHPAGRKQGGPLIDWETAFLFYAGLPPEQRTYNAVARQFQVSVRTVERHGREEHWKSRARELDRQATAAAAERLRDQRVEQLDDYQKLVQATLVSYANDLRAGKVRHTVTDLTRLYALHKSLWSDSDDWDFSDPEQDEPRTELDPTVRKLEILRALNEVGALDQLFSGINARVGGTETPDNGDNREPPASDEART